MKKFIAGMICGAVLMLTTSVFADGAYEQITAYLDHSIKVEVDGKKVELANTPVNYDGSTYLPVRELAGAVGLSVDWDEASRTAKLNSGKSPAVAEPGATTPAEENGKPDTSNLVVLKEYYPGIDAIKYKDIIYIPASKAMEFFKIEFYYDSKINGYTFQNTNISFYVNEKTSKPGDDGFSYNGIGYLRDSLFQQAKTYIDSH